MFHSVINVDLTPANHASAAEQLKQAYAQHLDGEMNKQRNTFFPELCGAVYMNKTRDVEFLLNTGHNVNERMFNGRTALHMAIQRNYTPMTALLIHKGANVNAVDDKGLTPLHIACYFRQGDTVRLLVKNKANVHAKDSMGTLGTPILSAIIYNEIQPANAADLIDVVEVLIKHGANVNDKIESTGLMPLHFAVRENNIKVVEFLIANKADVNISMCGMPVLMYAVDQDYTEIVKAFLKCKSLDLNHKDPYLNTALHKACLDPVGNMTIVKLLVEKGFDVNAQNIDGLAPLHLALGASFFPLAEYLVNQDSINVNLTVRDQNIFIHLALEQCKMWRAGNQLKLIEQVTKRIIDKTDDLNERGELGTPLIHAAKINSLPIVKYLLGKGASVHVKCLESNVQLTALHYACQHRGNLDMVKLLLDHGIDVNHAGSGFMNQPLGRAIRTGDFAMVQLLQTYGAQIDKTYVERNMSEMKMCYNQKEITERMKIDDLLRLNLKFLKNVRSNKYDEVKRNIEAGACVNVSTARCGSGLIYASWKQYTDIVDLLLVKGADVNFKSTTGYTSLHMACRCHPSDVIAWKLLQHGAYYNLRDDKKNKTPRRHAREGKKNNMDTLLQLIHMVFRDVISKHEEIVINLKYVKTNYTHLFDLLKLVKNSKGDSLVSLANSGKEKCEILREINDLLTEGSES
uniref:Ankyrin repeat protein RF_0381 n=1 Tax=Cacopsylla melanoneura TaxID=428564 RepID=A0A8D9AV51_9HEMI